MKHLKKLIALAMVAATVLAVAVPAMAATEKYVSTTPDVNMRKTASTNGTIIIRVPNCGTVYTHNTIVVNGVSWDYVQFGNQNGYIQSQYLTTGASPLKRPTSSTQAFGLSTLQKNNNYNFYMIKNVQLCLYLAGFLSSTGIDGVFGNNTETAVKQYQASRNLGVDGKVGPATRAAFWLDYEYSLNTQGYMK
jgi:peptidoglycan hydrolase-like protein with peptidoglycan-binding domain